MYELGKHFNFDLNKSTANKDCIFKGDKYRITVLTERLLRLEYNENGMFEDYPTELIWYRNLPKPEFNVEEDNKTIKITTKYFELFYQKEKQFKGNKFVPTKNLKISLLGTDRVWYYGHPEVKNFGMYNTKSKNFKKKEVQKSLYSLDGFASIDDSKTSLILENGTFKKRDNSGVDIYVFMYNKDFYYCLSDYFAITGYPPLIPRYALGTWWDKEDFYNEFDVVNFVKKFEKNNIPISVFILNKWESNNEFKFNEFYRDPKVMIDYLTNKKIKFGLSINDPITFKANTLNFDKLKEYLSTDKNGNIPFNVYDARTIDAFLKLIIHPLSDNGVMFYSLDTFDKNNLERLSILKHYLYFDNLRDQSKRPMISAYNSLLASHRYPILYAGESIVGWDSLKEIPFFNSSATNLGISFWSHDFGGTKGGIEDSELFTRYIELGTFSPILRLGSAAGKYYKREPWKWGIKTSKIVIDYINLRYKLIPYIYTESYKYFKYGKPLIEPIYYRVPYLYDDPIYSNEYFFGSTFFISPIITKKDLIMDRVIQRLFIPDGVWYDYFTGKKYTGNKKYVSFYKDEEYPTFVKAGAIIPKALNNYNDTSVPSSMEIEIFPGDNNTYSIYEDDGESNSYLKGEYLITNVEFVYKKNDYRITILPVEGRMSAVPKVRNYRIRLKNTKESSNVFSYVASTQVSNSIYKDSKDLIIEIPNVPTSSQLTILCSGDNIEIEDMRIINDDIVSIISDLPIKTVVKERVDKIMFSGELTLKQKRIAIRKLSRGKDYLEKKYIELFLKLLEYISEV